MNCNVFRRSFVSAKKYSSTESVKLPDPKLKSRACRITSSTSNASVLLGYIVTAMILALLDASAQSIPMSLSPVRELADQSAAFVALIFASVPKRSTAASLGRSSKSPYASRHLSTSSMDNSRLRRALEAAFAADDGMPASPLGEDAPWQAILVENTATIRMTPAKGDIRIPTCIKMRPNVPNDPRAFTSQRASAPFG